MKNLLFLLTLFLARQTNTCGLVKANENDNDKEEINDNNDNYEDQHAEKRKQGVSKKTQTRLTKERNKTNTGSLHKEPGKAN